MAASADVDPILLARCLENALERGRQSARAIDGRLLEEGDGVLLIAAPGVPWITGATITRVPRDPAATLIRARDFFATCGLDWALTAAGEVATAIAPTAAALGLVPGERRPGMLLTPPAATGPDVPGLEIRVVRDRGDLAVFVATSAAGFGGEDLFPLMYQPASLAIPDLTLYLGELEGRPVATAVKTASHRIAGIGGVSTVPTARRRGVGEAITRRAAMDGFAEGCIASFLQASAMGFGVYQRMGYRHVIDFHTWEMPA